MMELSQCLQRCYFRPGPYPRFLLLLSLGWLQRCLISVQKEGKLKLSGRKMCCGPTGMGWGLTHDNLGRSIRGTWAKGQEVRQAGEPLVRR